MDRLPVELLYILAFIGFILFNFVMRKLAQRRQQEEAAQAPPAEEQPPEEQPLDDIWGRTPTQPTPVVAAALPAPVLAARAAPILRPAERSLPRRLHPVRALLNDRRDLRRAVVLMMVLGPCRAQEPPER